MPVSDLVGGSLLWAGSVICLVAALCINMSRSYNGINYNREKQKWMFWGQLATALLLAADAVASEFDGYPGMKGYWIVNISNFILFVQSNVVLFFFHQHVVCHLFPQMKERKAIKRVRAVCIIAIIGILMVCVSQFTGLYYTFDAANVYHRSPAYIISVLIPASGMMLDLSLLVQFRNNSPRSIFVAMMSYVVLPVVAAIVQYYRYGMPLIDLSIGFSMVWMYITAIQEQNKEVEELSKSSAQTMERLEIETILNKCVSQLSTGKNLDDSINQLLRIIDDYFDADRTYIFEADYTRDIMCNTYEYARDHVTEEKDNLQGVPIEQLAEWMESFQRSQVYYISDLEEKRDAPFYDLIHDQGITRLIEVPLQSGNEIIGFLGVDNPKKHYDDATLLSSLRFFVTNSLEKRKEQEYLEYLSYRDMLTKLYNRNKYMEVLSAYKAQPPKRIGVAYIDLNGLKKINDEQGHEAGDALIRRAGSTIGGVFPENSYRIGGDEFVVLMLETDEKEFFEKIEVLSSRLKENQVSVSAGVLWRASTDNLEELLQEADHSMYAEKEQYHQKYGYYRR